MNMNALLSSRKRGSRLCSDYPLSTLNARDVGTGMSLEGMDWIDSPMDKVRIAKR